MPSSIDIQVAVYVASLVNKIVAKWSEGFSTDCEERIPFSLLLSLKGYAPSGLR